jgi:ParB/RepB/Spo0J family partition protein
MSKEALREALQRTREATDASGGELLHIDPAKLYDHPNNVRRRYRADTITELAQSIKAQGIIEPLKAYRSLSGDLVLIAGHRRKRAAIEAGLRTVPALVVAEPNESDLLDQQLIENIQREELTPLDIARSLKRKIDNLGGRRGSATIVAENVGKSNAWVSVHMQLLDLHPDVIALADDEIVTERQSLMRLNHLSDEERAKEIARLRGEESEDAGEEASAKRTRTPPTPHQALTAFFGVPVYLERSRNKAALRIAAPNTEVLQGVLDRLNFRDSLD